MATKNRYSTLDVSLNMDSISKNKSRLSHTIEINKDIEQLKDENEAGKVNKFKELYFKNQKLRKQLKLLNERLNEKLSKLKLPSVKNKTYSVDLNHKAPSKAQQRQLENAYKQIKMYKKQVEVLKIKEQTPQNYDRLRNMENLINFKDYQISQVQQELKSIKNVKKLQQRVMLSDLENDEVKQRLDQYLKEIKDYKDKLKDMERKRRKRQMEYKKQQAYLVNLEKKIRKRQGDNDQEQQVFQKPVLKEQANLMNLEQIQIVKYDIMMAKKDNQNIGIKIETAKKAVRVGKQKNKKMQQKRKEKDIQYKLLLQKLQSCQRIVRQQSKDYYQTQHLQDKSSKQQKSNIYQIQGILQNQSEDSSSQGQKFENNLSSKFYQPQSKQSNAERQWKGPPRKVTKGYSSSTDKLFQQSGFLKGMKIYLDESRFVCGISPLTTEGDTQVFGNYSSMQLKWETQQQSDYISSISGCFSEQGYLAEVELKSSYGMSAKLGGNAHNYIDQFSFKLQVGERFNGIFGGIRHLGQDTRITEIGFWVTNQ